MRLESLFDGRYGYWCTADDRLCDTSEQPARDAIASVTADHDVIDLVIVGTHGRTGFDRYVLGSVTEQLVRTATVPVLSVREPLADQS